MTRSAPRRPSGVLVTLAALLLASGLLRLVGDAGSLIALAAEDVAEAPMDPETCSDPAELEALLQAMAGRDARITEREGQIADRLQALQVAEAQLTDRIAALDAAEAALAATLALAQTAASDDLTRLTTVYENMKPKDAAAVFAEMSPDFAAGFLARMRPDAAAAILAGLEPATAYTFSVMLAGRNAGVPTE